MAGPSELPAEERQRQGAMLTHTMPLDSLPPARHSDHLWAASCREVSNLNTFSAHTLLYRPDCRLFCPDGPGCRLIEHEEHRRLFLHVDPAQMHAEVLASSSTVVANRPQLDVVLPRVPCCTALPLASVEELPRPPTLPPQAQILTNMRGTYGRSFLSIFLYFSTFVK